MQALISRAQAVVAVSHDLASIAQLCNRVIWLDHGQIRMAGETREVIDAYRRCMLEPSQSKAA